MSGPFAHGSATAHDLAATLVELCGRHLPPGATLSVDDGFFEAGLNSMAVADISVALADLGVPVSLIDFFRHQNIRNLAAELSVRMTGTAPTRPLPWAGRGEPGR